MDAIMTDEAKRMRQLKIKEFIKENRPLFWYIKEEVLENISVEFLVETILHYGSEKSVKGLFDLLGIRQVAGIFYKQISGNRVNYPPRTVHFFDLYFKKHAHA